ncbi:hypothetical protein DMI62_05700 [Escherichia coli]|nr:hypothetical protein [Escherichia coli]
MDGNGRWAKAREDSCLWVCAGGKIRPPGCLSFAANNGIEALTLYAFSSETGTDQRRKSVR